MGLVSILVQLLLVAVIVCKASKARSNKPNGPYKMLIYEIHKCDEQGLDLTNFEIHPYFIRAEDNGKLNKLLFKGHFSFPFTAKEVDASTVHYKYERRSNMDYLPEFDYETSLCDAITGTGKEYYEVFRKASNIEQKGCYIKPGNYSFTDWHVHFGVPNPVLRYGHYRITLNFKIKKKVYSCVRLIVEVKEKDEDASYSLLPKVKKFLKNRIKI